jgi:hypothetical protein
MRNELGVLDARWVKAIMKFFSDSHPFLLNSQSRLDSECELAIIFTH